MYSFLCDLYGVEWMKKDSSSSVVGRRFKGNGVCESASVGL
jgi:hypothetical protein